MVKLSQDFAGNKGKLPWPVERGIITGRYGKHPHPLHEYIEINNNGIDIGTIKGATARAIFNGTVLHVGPIPGGNQWIMLNHGEYFTVYSNLSQVYIKKGDKVTTNQSLGPVYTNDTKGKTQVHLEIWKGTTNQPQRLNPEYWIVKK